MKVYIKDRTLIKHEKESSKLRIGGGSWTIQTKWLNDKVDNVLYITPAKQYKISLNEAWENGFIREFQGESKLVVPIKYWS